MKPSHFANALYVLAVLFLAFTAGIAVSLTRVWPYPVFHDAYRAAQAELAQSKTADPLATDLWRRARTDARGVTVHDASKMQPGYTLFTSGDASVARLIDADGRVVHQWKKPFSEIWMKNAAVKHPQADNLIYMRRAVVLPNGHLLAIYISGNDTPWGYGLVELDADSHIVWRYLDHVHHDMDRTNDGRIVTLTHEFTRQTLPGAFDFIPEPYLEDFLVTLSPNGKPLSRISLTRMLASSPYNVSLKRREPWYADFDPLHPNTVDWLGPKDVENLGFGKPGDVLVMMRSIDLLVLIDPDRRQIVWGMHGNWLEPHDPHILPNGHILMFDNLGNMKPNNPSRVIEFNPHNDAITWAYTGSPGKPLNSPIRSTSQRLANGNTLITESDGGRLIEVTPAGRIVWEYVSPIRAGGNNDFIPVLSGGRRIDPASLNEDFRAALAAREEQLRTRAR